MGWLKKIKKGVKKAAGKVGSGIKKGAKGVAKGAKGVAKGVSKGVRAAGKIGGKIGKGIAKGVKKGVMFGVSIVGNVALLPLAPYIPMMRRAIKKKGKKPDKSLLGIVKQFRKYVLQKQSYDCSDGTYFSYDEYKKNYLDPITVSALVKLIMGYINKIKAKEAAGEELSKNEQEMLDLAKDGEQAVIDGATDEAKFRIGDWVMDNKMTIGVTVVSAIGLAIALIGRASKKG